MKTITLKLTKLQQEILLHHLWQNICSGSCFMKHYSGHFPRHDCDSKCPKFLAESDLRSQLKQQLERKK